MNDAATVKGGPALQPIDRFFFAAEARNDRWRELMSAARRWDTAGTAVGAHSAVAKLFAEIVPLEDYWAYPGLTLMRSLKEALDGQNAGVFARLAQKVGRALISGTYRYEVTAWDPLQESQVQGSDFLPPS